MWMQTPKTNLPVGTSQMADGGIVPFHQLIGVNHDVSMRPMPDLQIPRVVAGHIILVTTLAGSHFSDSSQNNNEDERGI
jgi:hypothetical protein